MQVNLITRYMQALYDGVKINLLSSWFVCGQCGNDDRYHHIIAGWVNNEMTYACLNDYGFGCPWHWLTAKGSACSQLMGAPHDEGLTLSGKLSGTATNIKNTSNTAMAVAKATTNVSLYRSISTAPRAGDITWKNEGIKIQVKKCEWRGYNGKICKGDKGGPDDFFTRSLQDFIWTRRPWVLLAYENSQRFSSIHGGEDLEVFLSTNRPWGVTRRLGGLLLYKKT